MTKRKKKGRLDVRRDGECVNGLNLHGLGQNGLAAAQKSMP
jgi:hypothetical protein